jgi:hypothetical protein
MAKTPRLKSKPSCKAFPNPRVVYPMSRPLTHNKLAANPRSRVSKRATSPSIDLDKSLKSIPRNDEFSQPALAPRPGVGITKRKSKRGNAKTRGQKIRQERGLQRAEAVMDQMEKKVEGAKQREGRRRERRKVWEEVNSGVNGVGKTAQGKVGGSVGEEEKGGEWQWEDVDGEVEDGDKEMEIFDGAEVPDEDAVMPEEPTEPPKPVVVAVNKVVIMDHLNGIEFDDEIT